MTRRNDYRPGAAAGAHIDKTGDRWTLVVTRDLRHSPDQVWQALVEPEQLREWAPFDADRHLGTTGARVRLTTVGATNAPVSDTTVIRAEAPRVLEYNWGEHQMRWQLEPIETGTRLTLWHNIDRRFISMGAAGWHLCFDVLAAWLGPRPIGRIVGVDAMAFEWARLNKEYAAQFGLDTPTWPPAARTPEES